MKNMSRRFWVPRPRRSKGGKLGVVWGCRSGKLGEAKTTVLWLVSEAVWVCQKTNESELLAGIWLYAQDFSCHLQAQGWWWWWRGTLASARGR